MKRRLILMGTGPFAVPSFEAIREAGHDIALVITRPMPPVKSRGGPPPSPVRDWATEHELNLEAPDSINDDATIERLRGVAADLLVVCDYGQILKPAALESARWGGINLHGSLLPAYRGAAPVQRALLSGDAETGVSVIHMTPRLDGGPILATRTTPISDSETAGELEERLAEIGVDATIEAIKLLDERLGDHVAGEPLPIIGAAQDPERVSKAPRLSKAEAAIDWSASAAQIDRLVRGMQPWPVAYTFAHVKEDKPPIRLAIRQVEPVGGDQANSSVIAPEQAGRLIDLGTKDELAIACGDGYVIVRKLQPAGKKVMDAAEFVRGHRPNPGTRFTADGT